MTDEIRDSVEEAARAIQEMSIAFGMSAQEIQDSLPTFMEFAKIFQDLENSLVPIKEDYHHELYGTRNKVVFCVVFLALLALIVAAI